MSDTIRPITFRIAKWYGIVFSLLFLILGGVNIILAFMDKKFDGFAENLLVLAIGAGLIMVALAFSSAKQWAWYGLLGICGLTAIYALINIGAMYNWIFLVFSLVATAMILVPSTKLEFFPSH